MGNGATSGDLAKAAGTYFDEKTYTVKLTVKDGSQTSTASQTITVYKKPVVDFSALPVKICANSPVSFTSSSSAGDGTISNYAAASNNVIQWTWSPPDYLNCANCPSPVSKPRAPITYEVKVTDNYGCAAKDSVKIDLFCSQNLVFIPSAFTPNKDGVNDRFNIKGNGVKTVRHLRIFNRWGEAVFEKNNFNIDDRAAGWDGTYRNIEAPLGAYVYMIELVCDTNEVFDYKGTVTLIR